MLGVMVDRLVCHTHFRAGAQRQGRILVSGEAGKVAAGNVDAQAVAGLEHMPFPRDRSCTVDRPA